MTQASGLRFMEYSGHLPGQAVRCMKGDLIKIMCGRVNLVGGSGKNSDSEH